MTEPGTPATKLNKYFLYSVRDISQSFLKQSSTLQLHLSNPTRVTSRGIGQIESTPPQPAVPSQQLDNNNFAIFEIKEITLSKVLYIISMLKNQKHEITLILTPVSRNCTKLP